MSIIDAILNFCTGSLGGAATTVAIILEFLFRAFPTARPWSFLSMAGVVLEKLAKIFAAGGAFLNNVKPKTVA
jgi:hypothetical protein